MNEKEQLAHEKALAYTQSIFMSEVEESKKDPHPNRELKNPIDKMDTFNYDYCMAYKFFLEEGNKY